MRHSHFSWKIWGITSGTVLPSWESFKVREVGPRKILKRDTGDVRIPSLFPFFYNNIFMGLGCDLESER